MVGVLGCPTAQSSICKDYLECQAALDGGGTQASLVDLYGPEGTCWTDSLQAAACDVGCQAAIDNVPSDGPVECGGDGTGAPVGCNTIANQTTAVSSVNIDAAYPTATGGVVTDGTYLLANHERYRQGEVAGPNGDTYQTTIVISAGGTVLDLVTQKNAEAEARATAAIATNGGALTLTASCPAGAQIPVNGFDAAAGVLVIYSDQFSEVTGFTLQP